VVGAQVGDGNVSIVIPTRGSKGKVGGREVRWVDNAIRGILENTRGLAPEIVLVVDSDVPLDYLEPWRSRLGPRLVVVPTPPPFNFSRKINQGVRQGSGEFILFYNDDVFPISPDWLEHMLGFAAQPEVGAVGAQLLYEDRTIQHVGHAYAHGEVFHFDAGKEVVQTPGSRNTSDRRVSGVTAACLLQRRVVWDQLGGLDESLPNNFNDVDYCDRLDRHHYQIVQCNTIQLFHYETQTRRHGAEAWEVNEIARRLGPRMAGPDEYTVDILNVASEPRRRPFSALLRHLRTKS
jgi:GT2 family glycosyltransferase